MTQTLALRRVVRRSGGGSGRCVAGRPLRLAFGRQHYLNTHEQKVSKQMSK